MLSVKAGHKLMSGHVPFDIIRPFIGQASKDSRGESGVYRYSSMVASSRSAQGYLEPRRGFEKCRLAGFGNCEWARKG